MKTLEITAEPADPYVGNVLRGRYHIDSLLGSGAMGAVYKARDLELDAPCAVKLLHMEGRMREAARVRFLDEARLVAQIFHPHIVEMYDHGSEEDGTLFLVMELLCGKDLDTLLRRQHRLPLQQALDIVRQLGSALHAVHQAGIVHRDIKPRNIFLTSHGEGNGTQVVKLIDFGLAKYLNPNGNRGSDGLLIGTPEYLPPEAWHGVSAEVDTRADQWALAVMTFRMLTGELPFNRHIDTMMIGKEIATGTPRRIRELVPEIPEHIEVALQRALSKPKEERYPTVQSFVRAILRPPLSTSVYRSDAPTSLRPSIPRLDEIETAMLPLATVVLPALNAIQARSNPPAVPDSARSASPASESTQSFSLRKRRPMSRTWAVGLVAGILAAIPQGLVGHQILSTLKRVELATKLAVAQAAAHAPSKVGPVGTDSGCASGCAASPTKFTPANEPSALLLPLLDGSPGANSRHPAPHPSRNHRHLSSRSHFDSIGEERPRERVPLRREPL